MCWREAAENNHICQLLYVTWKTNADGTSKHRRREKDNVILTAPVYNVKKKNTLQWANWHSKIQQINPKISQYWHKCTYYPLMSSFIIAFLHVILNALACISMRGHMSLSDTYLGGSYAKLSRDIQCADCQKSSNTQISCNTFQMQSGKSQAMIRSSVVAVFVVNTVPLWGLNVCVGKE